MRNIRFLSTVFLFLFFATLTITGQEDNRVVHVVQPGENLFRIGLRYGVTLEDLSSANNITDAANVYAGQELVIPGLVLPANEDQPSENAVVDNPLVAAAPISHTVQRGETLTQIAATYDVSVDIIMRANNITNPSHILFGTELQIWAPTTLDQDIIASDNENAVDIESSDETLTNSQEPEERVEYVVQAGEHLSQIARKFNVSWLAIAEVNNITDPDTVYAGITLIIPNGTDIVSQNVAYASYNNILSATTDPGARVGTGREIVVVLSTQMTYAYEDGELKYSALVSTGLPATPTVQGDYKIWNKTRSQTMSGPGYYLENVEWVMYFYQGYGFHGTWWHDNFGQPMSHGCVNMTNEDAKWLYEFASLETPVHVRFY